jgi:hypothetical protein
LFETYEDADAAIQELYRITGARFLHISPAVFLLRVP